MENLDFTNPKTPIQGFDPMLTPSEVCAILRIRPTTLRKLRIKKKLVPTKVEGQNRYFRKDVEVYLASLVTQGAA